MLQVPVTKQTIPAADKQLVKQQLKIGAVATKNTHASVVAPLGPFSTLQ